MHIFINCFQKKQSPYVSEYGLYTKTYNGIEIHLMFLSVNIFLTKTALTDYGRKVENNLGY